MRLRLGPLNGHVGALAQRGQQPLLVGQFRLGVVGALDVGAAKSRELDTHPRGAQSDCHVGVKGRDVAQRARETDAVLGESRVDHLRRDGAFPDEFVEGSLVTAELSLRLVERAEGLTGRTDGLVGLLGVLHFAVVAARRVGDVVVAEHRRGLGARGVDRLVRERRGVGAHVGDPALFVKTLGGAHRSFGVEAQLATGFDLQGRGHEGRLGTLRARRRGHRRHRETLAH